MSGLRTGSVCTGYGGLDEAVQKVFGGSLAWVADNDPGAARILAHHHPQVPNLGDLTAVDWRQVLAEHGPVDIVCGGYPCQPFSSAGKRKGTADARHIWPYIARALGVLRPRYAVFENVAGHLSLGFDTVLADLAALGFDAEWCTLRADEVGAAHQRKRLFLLARLAHTPGAGREGQGLPGRSAECRFPAAHALDLGGNRAGQAGREPQRHAAGPDRAAAHPAGVGEREPADQTHAIAGSRDPRQVPGRGGGQSPADTDGGRCEGDQERHGWPEDGQPEREPGLDALGCGVQRATAADPAGDGRDQGRPEPTGQQGGSDAPFSSAPDWGEYGPAIARWEAVIGRPAPRPVDDLGRLNPPFVEWLMGLAAGHVTEVPGLSRTAQLKALGNGVLPLQAITGLRHLAARMAADQDHRAGAAA